VLSDATQYGFRLGGQLESFELHNNVIYGNGPTQLWREEYVGTMNVSGGTNWLSDSLVLPDGRITGLLGTDPGLTDLAGGDLRPTADSPLLDAATPAPPSPPGMAVPNAEDVPPFHPVVPGVQDYQVRHQQGELDIGAFELGGESDGEGGGPTEGEG